MNRSPRVSTAGDSSRSRASADPPPGDVGHVRAGQRDAAEDFRGAVVHAHPRAVLQRPAPTPSRSISTSTRRVTRQRVAATPASRPARRRQFDAAKIDRRALSGRGRLFGPPMDLDAADLRRGRARLPTSTRRQRCTRARDQRAGHDGAESLHREHAIDRQAHGAATRAAAAAGWPPRRCTSRSPSRPCAGSRRHFHHGLPSRNDPCTSSATSYRHQRAGVGVGERRSW